MKILFEDNHILVASADDISSADAAKHIRSATGKEGAVFVHMLTSSSAGLGVFAKSSKAKDRVQHRIKQTFVSKGEKSLRFAHTGDWLWKVSFTHPISKQKMEFTSIPEWPEYKTAFEKALNGYCVLYHDKNIIVTDKASKVLTAAADGGKNTLEHRLRLKFGEVYAVHRLDFATGGIVVFARNKIAKDALDDGMRRRTFNKTYECAVKGRPEPDSASLTAYCIKNSRKGKVSVYSSPKKGALTMKTAYKTIKTSGSHTLLEVSLITGRTHQIRAHLAFIGHPIIGDDKYGGAPEGSNLMLCARKLKLNFNSGPLAYLDGREFKDEREWDFN